MANESIVMKEFVLTSKKFEGTLHFKYENEVLVSFENNAKLDDVQLEFFVRNFPFKSGYLELIKGTGQITEITDLSFNTFWTRYGYKVDKVNAEKYWKKMSDPDKVLALAGIVKYKNNCNATGIGMVYPERYLKNKRWLDENQIK